MSEPRFRYLQTRVEQGVLIATLSPKRLEGDEMAHQILADVQAAVAHFQTDKLVINLEHVELMTTANFRPFLALRKQMLAAGGRLILCHLSDGVRESFEVTRLLGAVGAQPSHFHAEEDVAAALAALQTPAAAPPAS